MLTQLRMFEGVQGNKLGEYGKTDLAMDPGKASTDLGKATTDLGNASTQQWQDCSPELDELLDSVGSPESVQQLEPEPRISKPEDDGPPEPQRQTPRTIPDPTTQPVRFLSESNVSESHPNPYGGSSHASIWARVRSFFLLGFKED